MNNDDDQEIFNDAIESASENFIENQIDSQKDYDKSEVDHNDSKEKEHLVDKLIRKFNHKIAKWLNENNADLLAQTKVLQDQLKVKHVVIDTHTECQAQYAKLEEERYEYMIRYSALCDNDKQHRKKIDEQEILFDKMSRQLVEINNNMLRLQEKIIEKETKISELEGCVSNKDVEIEKCLERLIEWIGFENLSYFEKAKDLRPSLYDEKVIGLGYTSMFLIHSDEALEIEKFERARENKIDFAYDYGNLNARYQTSSLKPYVPTVILEKIIIDLEDEVMSLMEKEKANLKTIVSLKSKGCESNENAISESENQSENDCHVVKKECDKVENSKVIASGMFKLSVSQSVSPISMSKTSGDSKNVESKLKRKRRKRKSSKQNDKQVNSDVSLTNRDFVHFLDLNTFSSVRRHKHSDVIWKKKWSSNTSNVNLSSVSLSKLNKNVKRYSRQELLSCNNSHLEETSSAYVCNDTMNVSCNSRMCDLFDDNNFFIFDDESVRISPVSKMPFRKKSCDSLNVRSKSNSNKSLPRTVHKWLPKLQPLAEPVAKWFPKIVQIYLWIIDLGCSKHMTGNRALLTNFMEKFLETVRFGNNDFAVIAGYGDVVIGSMTIKKVYYIEGLPKMKFKKDHLCSACEQGKIHRKHYKSKTAFASNKPLYLLHMDLCRPMHVESINRKRYVLVVVDDYSRYTWVFFLHSKDEASEVIISFINKTQVNLQLQVQRVQTDNGTEFKNKTLVKFFDEVGITQQFFAARAPQQNGAVERRNRTLVEAARTMLTFATLPSFLLAESIVTTCFTQNRSIIYKRFDKTPYELINKRKLNIKFFRVFRCRCYLLNDYEDVRKLKAKWDIGVFIGYSKESAAFRIYSKRTRKIHESVNVNFDEISEMDSKQFSLEPGLSNLNKTGKSSNPSVSKVSEASKKDLEDLF
nr:retrovirus-related Pol polyprotein from transposon TNT 1-94 [Tanacetum cinerariifolium]